MNGEGLEPRLGPNTLGSRGSPKTEMNAAKTCVNLGPGSCSSQGPDRPHLVEELLASRITCGILSIWLLILSGDLCVKPHPFANLPWAYPIRVLHALRYIRVRERGKLELRSSGH